MSEPTVQEVLEQTPIGRALLGAVGWPARTEEELAADDALARECYQAQQASQTRPAWSIKQAPGEEQARLYRDAGQQTHCRVSLQHLVAAIHLTRACNNVALQNIHVIGPDGREIPLPAEAVEEWRFVGLNNLHFLRDHIPAIQAAYEVDIGEPYGETIDRLLVDRARRDRGMFPTEFIVDTTRTTGVHEGPSVTSGGQP